MDSLDKTIVEMQRPIHAFLDLFLEQLSSIESTDPIQYTTSSYIIEGIANDYKPQISFQSYVIEEKDYLKYTVPKYSKLEDTNFVHTISINATSVENADEVKSSLSVILQLLTSLPQHEVLVQFFIRVEGKKIALDLVVKNIDHIFHPKIKFSKFGSFFFQISTALNILDIFNLNCEEVLEKLLSIDFEFSNHVVPMKEIQALGFNILEKMNIEDNEILKKIRKTKMFLQFLNLFIFSKMKIKYSAKEIVKYAKQSYFFKNIISDFQQDFKKTQLKYYNYLENIKSMLETFQMSHLITQNMIDFDSLELVIEFVKMKEAYYHIIQLPGLTALLNALFEKN